MEIIHTFVILAYKESKYLEDCILSVLAQTSTSKVIIATSTCNAYIERLAKAYQISICENPNAGKGIGNDFDFAIACANTTLVTVAHQDDIYDPTYVEEILNRYKRNKDSTILFSDYYEIRDTEKVYKNTNLKIKRMLLLPLRSSFLSHKKFGKRLVLRFGNAICCPAVTFVKDNIPMTKIFECEFKCNVDWNAWEKISKIPGRFSFVKKPLMGHRVHEESTTTEIINDNIRTKEDFIMFTRFWPTPIAKALNTFYVKAEQSNT